MKKPKNEILGRFCRFIVSLVDEEKKRDNFILSFHLGMLCDTIMILYQYYYYYYYLCYLPKTPSVAKRSCPFNFFFFLFSFLPFFVI